MPAQDCRRAALGCQQGGWAELCAGGAVTPRGWWISPAWDLPQITAADGLGTACGHWCLCSQNHFPVPLIPYPPLVSVAVILVYLLLAFFVFLIFLTVNFVVPITALPFHVQADIILWNSVISFYLNTFLCNYYFAAFSGGSLPLLSDLSLIIFVSFDNIKVYVFFWAPFI